MAPFAQVPEGAPSSATASGGGGPVVAELWRRQWIDGDLSRKQKGVTVILWWLYGVFRSYGDFVVIYVVIRI
jgi:hypothetical protein